MILLLFVLKVRMKPEEFILAVECFLKMICLNKASDISNGVGQIRLEVICVGLASVSLKNRQVICASYNAG